MKKNEVSANPQGPKEFCFIYVNFSYETWLLYLCIIGTIAMLLRAAYIFYKQNKRTKFFKTEILIYLMLVFWVICNYHIMKPVLQETLWESMHSMHYTQLKIKYHLMSITNTQQNLNRYT